jgi:hypothetical protein
MTRTPLAAVGLEEEPFSEFAVPVKFRAELELEFAPSRHMAFGCQKALWEAEHGIYKLDTNLLTSLTLSAAPFSTLPQASLT